MQKQEYAENEIKHLEMIQSVIERMGQNSFALKGWTMTLIVAICAFSAAGTERKFALVAIVPIIEFWLLDSFYLQKERKYRELFKRVTAHEATSFDMNISKVTGEKTSYIKCLFSITEWLFYLVCIVAIISVFVWLIYGQPTQQLMAGGPNG